MKTFAVFLAFLLTLTMWASSAFSATSLEQREAKLRQELQRIEEEQAVLQNSLNEQKGKTATIQRDVNILSDQIKNAELNIQKKRLEIQKLSQEVDLRNQTVNELDKKIERSKDVLAELVRKTYQADSVSLVEIILNNQNFSEFFSIMDSYNSLQKQLEQLLQDIREIKEVTEQEKLALLEKQDQEQDAKAVIEKQKNVVAVKKIEQDQLLSAAKNVEKTYEQVIAEKRQQAASIRAALFQLRDSAGIPFGEALEYAEEASKATGVRAAFILAILKQESDLGKNVGTCNLPGQPESKKWTSIMPGPNDGSWRDDQTIFKKITSNLGLDPDSMPLSCPWQGGWGGAMGPSQFIPYTWDAYSARIASVVGVKTANPWNPEHAIVATALYVKDLGAAGGGYTAERTAALKYYAGNNWNLPQNAFYGNSVMSHVEDLQKQIDFLNDVE